MKSVLRLHRWGYGGSSKDLRIRQEIAVVNRRKAIDDAHIRSLDTVPKHFWIGCCCRDMADRGLSAVIRQSGDFPDILKNDKDTTIYLSVQIESQKQEVCIVQQGKQVEVEELLFDRMLLTDFNLLKIQFKLFFVTGRFRKKKHRITSWFSNEDSNTVSSRNFHWKLIQKLSSKS